jgi:beta-phosphoglucomutase family hydrolase
MRNIITRERFDALLFDLDGVLTATARIHAASWKQMFDEFLSRRAGADREPFRPFEIATDYKIHVDGKPRFDGVRDFLRSRGIQLPEGSPDDGADRDTVAGLGNRKNGLVLAALAAGQVEVFSGSIDLVRHVRKEGFKTAVVSASNNCRAILRAASIEDLFDTRVDGLVATQRGLAGKPAPDTFLAAARELSVQPARAVVLEDALSGVQAGRAGGFGLVVGVNRHGDTKALLEQGADLVVDDLAELLPGGHQESHAS